MTDFPAWLTDALQQRIEKLYREAKKDDLIHLKRAEFDVLFHVFKKELSQEKRIQFLQLEESWTRLEGLEKEWIYKRGLKDGAQLMVSLLR